MAIQQVTIDLDETVCNEFLTIIRSKSKNSTQELKAYLEACLKKQVKIYRLSKISMEQKESLIDMTGLD